MYHMNPYIDKMHVPLLIRQFIKKYKYSHVYVLKTSLRKPNFNRLS